MPVNIANASNGELAKLKSRLQEIDNELDDHEGGESPLSSIEVSNLRKEWKKTSDEIKVLEKKCNSNSQNMVAADLSKVMTNFFDNTLKSYNLGVKVKADIDKKLKKIIKEASEEFSYVLDEIEERSDS